jgi:phthalate 4,5-dioxygenase
MGPLADRSRDKLGSSDLAIIHFRRQMFKAAQTMAAGGPAIGTGASRTPHASLTSFEGIVPKGTDWRALGERPAQAAE